jgi:hypothetical protein
MGSGIVVPTASSAACNRARALGGKTETPSAIVIDGDRHVERLKEYDRSEPK